MTSFCFSCGCEKSAYDHVCTSCGKAPLSEPELAASVLLCDIFQWEAAGLDYDETTIRRIAREISNNGSYAFPESDIEHAINIVRSANSKLHSVAFVLQAVLFTAIGFGGLFWFLYKLYNWLLG